MERLQKILAGAGVASRRKCEEFIVAGRVTVDGKVVRELGAKADAETSDIRLDGERVKAEKRLYYLVNKPRGMLCTNARSSDRPRVVDLFDAVEQRLFTVGRLDADSEGLLIVTNDGAFANRLAHPRYGVARTYIVDVDGQITREDAEKLKKGIHIAEGRVQFSAIKVRSAGRERSVAQITLHQGMNREIRRALAALGYRVRRLRRVAIGSLSDNLLKPGAFRRLTNEELEMLRRDAGLGTESRR
jgi:23S rRNA pseudouridine2605 synthase